MWRAWLLSAFAAAVASLAAADPAAAGDREQHPARTSTTESQDDKSLSLLGFNICIGESPTAKRCHIKLPALPQPQPPSPPKRFMLLGKTVCIGGAPGQPGCDWQLPQADLHS